MLGAAESPRWIRVAMLGVLIAGALYILYQQIWKRWLVRWSDDSIALLIERKYPSFESALITTVQGSHRRSDRSQHEDHPSRAGLLELARERALALLDQVDVPSLVRTRSLQIQLVVLGVLLALSIIIGLTRPTWSNHWGKRLFALSNAPWPRSVQLGVEGIEFEVPSFTGVSSRERYSVSFQEGRVPIPLGQSGLLKSFADLKGERVPETCTVYYRDDAGNRGRANMRRTAPSATKQNFILDGPPLESISQSLWLSIVGGDARLSELRLEAVDAPMVSDLKLRVKYPAYLQRSTQSRWGEETLDYRTGLRLPQGTEVEFLLTANKPIARCDFIQVQSSESTGRTEKEQTKPLPEPSDRWSLPIGVLESSALFEFRLWDEEGICSNRIQQFVLSTIIDRPPQVDMVLDGIGTHITEIASIPILGKVKDEYDVRDVWLESVHGEDRPMETKVARQTDEEVRYTLDCKELRDAGKFPMQVGSALALTLAASDFFDLHPETQVGKSNSVQLSIVTPDHLLLLLDRREAAMRRRLEQIIGETRQLRDLIDNIQKRFSGELEGESPASNEDETPQESAEERRERIQRVQLLRSQQAMSQISKSGSELNGVEKEIGQIGRELVNNRIDSVDRRTRWQEKIQRPLRSMLDTTWTEFASQTASLEKRFSQLDPNSEDIRANLLEALKLNDQAISTLESILADMLELQDQTAIIDMLRDIIDSSSQLIEETKGYKKDQDRKALELLQ